MKKLFHEIELGSETLEDSTVGKEFDGMEHEFHKLQIITQEFVDMYLKLNIYIILHKKRPIVY